MIHIFSRYLFAYSTQNVTAKTIGRCIVDVMTRHAYLPTLRLSDKKSQFRSELVAEKPQILEIQTSHASTKHSRTVGILERTHASIKTALNISTGERRSMLHKYAQIAVIKNNTTYHETLGCEPSTVFHGRIPYNVLDLKLGIKPKWKTTPNSEIAEQLQKQIDEVRATTKDNIRLFYLKYEKYYDRKALADPSIWYSQLTIIRSKKFARHVSKLYTDYENVHLYPNNAYLMSQHNPTNIFLIQTWKSRTTNCMPHHGRWIWANKLTNIQCQTLQVKLNSRQYRRPHIQMTRLQSRRQGKNKPNALRTIDRSLQIFQILLRTWGRIHIYVAPTH